MKESEGHSAFKLEHQEMNILKQETHFTVNVKVITSGMDLIKLLAMKESKF